MAKQAKSDIKAGIYLRISRVRSDGKEETLGVDRQLPPCRALAKRKEWAVADTYTDNDLGAYSEKWRPDYERMLTDVQAGRINAVVAWDADRLTRRPIENEALIKLAEQHGIQLATVTGEYDLATPSGRLHFRMLGNVARYESEHKAERLWLKHAELAREGKPKGGCRAYGFEPDGIRHRKTEAKLLREACRRVLGGDSLRSIIADWDRRGVTSANGKRWQTSMLKRTLLSPRVAGLREYHGALLHDDDGQPVKAVWKPIITPDEQDRLRRELDGRQHPGGAPAAARSYLLTGYAFCGYPDCGMALTTGTQFGRGGSRHRSYLCRKGPPRYGCGHITRHADYVEAYVAEVALELLGTREVTAALLAAGDDDGKEARLRDERDAILARLASLEDAFGDGTLTKPQYQRQVARQSKRLEPITAELDRVQPRRRVLAIPLGKSVEWAWHEGSIDVRRSLLASVVERVIVHPGRPGRARFNSDLIEIVTVPDITSLEVVQRIVSVTRAVTG